MKSTDLARLDRELKRTQKKELVLERKTSKSEKSIGDYINELYGFFFFDENHIHNISVDERIKDHIETMQLTVPEKDWEIIIRKAVRKTKVKEREEAVSLLKSLLG